MKSKRKKTHSADFLFTLVTFLIYAGAMILLVYLGTIVYRSITEQMELHYSTRTAQAYITEKIHQNDKSGAITTEEIDGKSVLVFREEIEGRIYITYIYEDAGQLKELYTREDSMVSLEDGNSLLELQGFEVEEIPHNGFRVILMDQNSEMQEFVIFQDSERQEGLEG